MLEVVSPRISAAISAILNGFDRGKAPPFDRTPIFAWTEQINNNVSHHGFLQLQIAEQSIVKPIMPPTRHSPFRRHYRPYGDEQRPAQTFIDETINPALLDLTQSLPRQVQSQQCQPLRADSYMGHPGALFMADPANSYMGDPANPYGGDPDDPYMVDPAGLQFLPLYAQPSLQPSIEQFPVHSTIGGTDVQRNRSFQTEDVFLAQLDARLIRAGALLGAAGGTTSNGTAGTPTTLSPYQRLKVISSWLASNPGYVSQSFYNR